MANGMVRLWLLLGHVLLVGEAPYAFPSAKLFIVSREL